MESGLLHSLGLGGHRAPETQPSAHVQFISLNQPHFDLRSVPWEGLIPAPRASSCSERPQLEVAGAGTAVLDTSSCSCAQAAVLLVSISVWSSWQHPITLSQDDFIFGIKAANTGNPLRDGECVGNHLGPVAPVWNWEVWAGSCVDTPVGQGGADPTPPRAVQPGCSPLCCCWE